MTFAAAAESSDRWNKLSSIKEKFFRQKSCVRWLGAGDQNTVFFHRAVQTRSSRNTIKILVNGAGETLTKMCDIKRKQFSIFIDICKSRIREMKRILYPFCRICSPIAVPLMPVQGW